MNSRLNSKWKKKKDGEKKQQGSREKLKKRRGKMSNGRKKNKNMRRWNREEGHKSNSGEIKRKYKDKELKRQLDKRSY